MGSKLLPVTDFESVVVALSYVFERGTSPVDWCEANYLHHPFIAEWANTISNFLFLLFPPLLCRLFSQYATHIDSGIYLIWTLFATVGICSAYFHATLSLMGQLLDELAILWLLCFAFGMWLPRIYFPSKLRGSRRRFKTFMLLCALAASFAACLYPWVNNYALMSLGIPTFMLLYRELVRCPIPRVRRLGFRCTIVWAAAVIAWVLDRILCDTWSAYNLPYLHGLWHILIAIAAYSVCVLFAYFNAVQEHNHLKPAIRFWPQDHFELGFPYIELKAVPV